MRSDALSIIEAGLAAASPAGFIKKFAGRDTITSPDGTVSIRLDSYSAIHALAFGKAAGSMMAALKESLQDRLKGGLVILPKGYRPPPFALQGKKFRVINARHPVPDHASVRAAKEAIKYLQAKRDGELVIFLISGGGSSLVALPDGVTLGEKIHTTETLLRCGATIDEINCVRGCLSQVKGGKLAEHLRCDGVGLLMSDVQGDDPAVIASGPTCTTSNGSGHTAGSRYSRAIRILEEYKISKKAGPPVMGHLRAMAQNSTNTSHTHQTAGRMIGNYVIAKNSDCLDAMSDTAEKLGYTVSNESPIRVFGDMKDAAGTIYDAIPDAAGSCVIFGGEPTVRVLGRGTGGRNQEMVLRLLKKMQRIRHPACTRTVKKITVASVGTDGIDGNSLYAGAIADCEPADVAAINDALKRSDATGFLERRRRDEGGRPLPPSCIRTGPTHANLMDVGVILT